jgi:hypothetical protein
MRSIATHHQHNGQTLMLRTYVHGGSPKTSCDVFVNGRWVWEYPHAFGYMLGFDVKANAATLEKAHKAAIERLQTLQP